MKIHYTNMDICFTVEGTSFYALNIIFERFMRVIPAHSHGSDCYEIHYIPYGYGHALINGVSYEITPNTLFVTGPHVEHSQAPVSENPMQEYCIYIKKAKSGSPALDSPIISLFEKNNFWFGQDSQGVHELMRSIFWELEHRYIGYISQVEFLLQQLIILLVRNYQRGKVSTKQFAPSDLINSKSVIIEEYFLYEYHNLSLDDLSARLMLSPRQTERMLLKYYGKNFQQKKTEARMAAAVQLLSENDRSVTEIADILGYSSLEHFSTTFKKYYHRSPREYRKAL